MTTRFWAATALTLLVSAMPTLAMTAQERDAALDHIADLVRDHYVYKDKAVKIADTLRGLKSDPAAAAISEERQFASYLTAKLLPYDRHFAVSWNPGAAKSSPMMDAKAVDAFMRQANYGFDEVKHLPGNVAYIRMSFFADFDTALTGDKAPPARKAAEAVLSFVANSDAVIFDLRQNGGGSPAMIDLLLSAFFKDKVLLNRFYKRDGDKTEDYSTLDNYRGVRNPDVPLYVLLGGGTASAAEEFSYDVKTQKRGVLVGEASYGGANPGSDFDAGGGFTIFISDGAAVNPVTGTNWEGVGVQPDIAVPQEQAFSHAYLAALKKVVAKSGNDAAEVRWALEQEEAKLHPPKLAPLKDFVGHYGLRDVTLKDGALYYRRGRAPAQKLVPLSPDQFGSDSAPDMRLQFTRNAKGKVESMTLLHAEGGASVFRRE